MLEARQTDRLKAGVLFAFLITPDMESPQKLHCMTDSKCLFAAKKQITNNPFTALFFSRK